MPTPQADSDSAPCNETGHNYEFECVIRHYTTRDPQLFDDETEFRVYKEQEYVCTKCDSRDFREVDLGRIKVDTETDELELIREDN